jgi:hypothetical protein
MKSKLKEYNPSLKDRYILESESPTSYSCGLSSGKKLMTNIPPIALKNINTNFGNSRLQFTPEKKTMQQSEM